MSRTTVRVDLPLGKPDELASLMDSVCKESDRLNALQANSSPLPAPLITSLKSVAASVKADRAAAKEHERQAQLLNEKARLALGMAKGQSVRTDGTGLNLLSKARDLLLAINLGHENALEPFGFPVVLGSAAAPKRKAKPE